MPENQFDLRFIKTLRFAKLRAQALLDMYNVFNSSTATTINQTYGPKWLKPQAIMNARYLRFVAQLDF